MSDTILGYSLCKLLLNRQLHVSLKQAKKYLTKSIVREFINKLLHAHKCIFFAPEYRIMEAGSFTH